MLLFDNKRPGFSPGRFFWLRGLEAYTLRGLEV